MRIKTKNNGRLKGSICELFAYTSHLVGYPDCSDMKELGENIYANEVKK